MTSEVEALEKGRKTKVQAARDRNQSLIPDEDFTTPTSWPRTKSTPKQDSTQRRSNVLDLNARNVNGRIKDPIKIRSRMQGEEVSEQTNSPYFPRSNAAATQKLNHEGEHVTKGFSERHPSPDGPVPDAHIPQSSIVYSSNPAESSSSKAVHKKSKSLEDEAVHSLLSVSSMEHPEEVKDALLKWPPRSHGPFHVIKSDGTLIFDIDPQQIARALISNNGKRVHFDGSLDTVSGIKLWYHLEFEHEEGFADFREKFKRFENVKEVLKLEWVPREPLS